MAYRNGTYIAFDGQGKTDPTQSDLKYLGLLRSWDKNSNFDFHFIDSHKTVSYTHLDVYKRQTRFSEGRNFGRHIFIPLALTLDINCAAPP